MGRMFRIIAAVLCLTATVETARAQANPTGGRLSGWAAILISADWRDGAGEPIPAFDNARRDLAAAFVEAGFDRALMADYSLRTDTPEPVTPEAALAGAGQMATQGQRGCLVYFLSHGNPRAMVFGERGYLSPAQMGATIDSWCGARPTVVVISACFSGIFIPALAAPNRLVMTAARHDRSSFGCGQGIQYPYFDECVLRALPEAGDFLHLAALTRTCVSRRETADGLAPASEPQMFVGSQMQLLAPTLRFSQPPD